MGVSGKYDDVKVSLDMLVVALVIAMSIFGDPTPPGGLNPFALTTGWLLGASLSRILYVIGCFRR